MEEKSGFGYFLLGLGIGVAAGMLWAPRAGEETRQILADRAGDRSPVIQDIVRLGEGYSIVSEYTSFLVLENDAEYQRWKIERRNLENSGMDRQAQAKRREQLEAIRNKALSEIGPQAASTGAPATPTRVASAVRPFNQPAAPAPAPQTQAQPQSSPGRKQSFDFSVPGSSPVGPLGVVASIWLLRRKKKAS